MSLNVECEHKELPCNNNSVGLDLGLKDLLIKSIGGAVMNPQRYGNGD